MDALPGTRRKFLGWTNWILTAGGLAAQQRASRGGKCCPRGSRRRRLLREAGRRQDYQRGGNLHQF